MEQLDVFAKFVDNETLLYNFSLFVLSAIMLLYESLMVCFLCVGSDVGIFGCSVVTGATVKTSSDTRKDKVNITSKPEPSHSAVASDNGTSINLMQVRTWYIVCFYIKLFLHEG